MAKSKDLSKAREALTQVRSQYPVIKRAKDKSSALEKEKTELKSKSAAASALSQSSSAHSPRKK